MRRTSFWLDAYSLVEVIRKNVKKRSMEQSRKPATASIRRKPEIRAQRYGLYESE